MTYTWRGCARLSMSFAATLVLAAGAAGCTSSSSPGPIGAPPTPGSVTETATAVTPPAPVRAGLKGEANLAGIAVSVTEVASTKVTTTVPGEGSGPALVFTLQLHNETSADYRSAALEVSLADSKGGAAAQSTSAPATTFPEVIAAGDQATAQVVFLIAADRRDPVTLHVSVAGGTQAAEFSGKA